MPFYVSPEQQMKDKAGRIVSFDAAGGRYEEFAGYHAIGSGSLFAKSSLKKLHDPTTDVDTTIRNAVEALYDAADDDSATGGPDLTRRIYPLVATITADGYRRLTDEAAGEYAQAVLEGRMTEPDGPLAALRLPGSSNGSPSALPPS